MRSDDVVSVIDRDADMSVSSVSNTHSPSSTCNYYPPFLTTSPNYCYCYYYYNYLPLCISSEPTDDVIIVSCAFTNPGGSFGVTSCGCQSRGVISGVELGVSNCSRAHVSISIACYTD